MAVAFPKIHIEEFEVLAGGGNQCAPIGPGCNRQDGVVKVCWCCQPVTGLDVV